MSSTLSLPTSTTGPRGASGRTDSAIARRSDVSGNGIDWNEIRSVCSAAIKAGILPRSITREDQAVAIALKARELGIPPMQGFSQIHMIQGVASCSAQLMLALAYRHLPEFDMQVIESSATKATMEFRRDAKRSPIRLTYTIEQAKAAGLTSKDNWRNHPDDMLRNRVVSKGLRMVAPDVFAGLYIPDEVESGAHVEAAEVVPMEIPSSPRRIVESVPAPVEAPREVLEVQPSAAPSEPQAPAPAAASHRRDEVLGFRRDIDRLIGSGGKPEIQRVSLALGLKLSGRKPSEWTDDEVSLVWDHAAPLGNKPLPAPVDPVTLADGTPEAAQLDADTPF